MAPVDKVHWSWAQAESAADQLADDLLTDPEAESGPPLQAIIAIGRGGLVPARLIAAKLEAKNTAVAGATTLKIPIYVITVSSYQTGQTQADTITEQLQWAELPSDLRHVAVVDDVIETGRTLDHVIGRLAWETKLGLIQIATFVRKEHSKVNNFMGPTHAAVTVKEWIVFPWE